MNKTFEREVRRFKNTGESEILSAVILDKCGDFIVDTKKAKGIDRAAAQDVCDYLNSQQLRTDADILHIADTIMERLELMVDGMDMEHTGADELLSAAETLKVLSKIYDKHQPE